MKVETEIYYISKLNQKSRVETSFNLWQNLSTFIQFRNSLVSQPALEQKDYYRENELHTVYKIERAQRARITLHNIKICAGKHLIVFKCEEKSIWALGKQKIKQRLVANLNLLHVQNKKIQYIQ